MSYYAISKNTQIKVHISNWLISHLDDIPMCPICNENLYVRADATNGTKPHFTHYKNSKCPLVLINKKRYELLTPTYLDKENAEKIKLYVKNHIFSIYLKCKEMLDGVLLYKEFKVMLEKANERNIWYYKGLTTRYIPYILLCCNGVFQKNKDRAVKVHFVFDIVLNNYDDLWNNPGTSSNIKQKIWAIYNDGDDFREYPINSINMPPDNYDFTEWSTKNIFK